MPNQQGSKSPQVFSDRPISTRAADELGYDAFAARLVKPLLNWAGGENLVVGLYGSWGSGKSSVMNLLLNHLKDRPDPGRPRAIPIRFNPWLYKDTETLLLSFFGTLAAEIKSRPELSKDDREALGDTFAEMGEALGPIFSLAESWGGFVKMVGWGAKTIVKLGQRDILQKKQKAEEQLRKLGESADGGCRVVVLIDDIDRLEPAEVRTCLKLVKLVADLPYVSYVLAMDQLRVAALLDTSTDGDTGLAYLEKIVQLPVYLPDPSATKLRELVLRSLELVLGRDPFGKGRLTDWNVSYETTLGRRLLTLRDRARLLNNLRFLLLGGEKRLEVHPLDATLLSFLQTFYPEAYHRVRRNRAFLIDEVGMDALVRRYSRKESEEARNRGEKWYRVVTGTAGLDSEEKFAAFVDEHSADATDYELVRDLIQALFPYVARGRSASGEHASIDRRENRIASPDRFDRYFSLQPPLDEVPDTVIDTVVSTLSDWGQAKEEVDSEVRDLFARWVTNGTLSSSLVGKVGDRLHGSPPELCVGVGRAALVLQGVMSKDDLLAWLHGSLVALSTLVTRHDNGQARKALKEMGIRIIAEVKDPLQAVLIADTYSEEKRDLAFDADERKSHAVMGVQRMAAFVETKANVFEKLDLFEATSVLWRWRDLLLRSGGTSDPLAEYVGKVLSNSPHNLPKVLSMAAGWGDGPALVGVQGRGEIIKSLQAIGGVERLLEIARPYLKRTDKEDPYGLVSQFVDLCGP